jgi:cell wall-associated NlpC family hydrolase
MRSTKSDARRPRDVEPEPVAMKNTPIPFTLARPLCALMMLVGAGLAAPAHANVPIPRLQWSEHLAAPRAVAPTPVAIPGIQLRMEQDANESLIRDVVLAKGHELLGTDYVYGAASDREDAVDCSSLVQRMFRSAGIKLPRTARELVRSGQVVRNRQFAPGDLLFYRWGRSGLHVAVYLPGDRILHASSSRREVVVSRLTSTWSRRMVAARRLIRSDDLT